MLCSKRLGFITGVFGVVLAFCAAAPAQEPAPSAAPQVSPEIDAQYKEALDKFLHSDIPGSLEQLEQMAASDPKMIPPRLIMAQWWTKLKNSNAVRLSLELAAEESPDDPEAFILLADNALSQGEWASAELLLGKAETLLNADRQWPNPDRKKNLNIALLKKQVVLNQARENWRGMQAYLSQLWKLDEKTSDTCKLIGISYFHLGDADKARQWLAQAYKISPETELPADAAMSRLYLADGDKQHAQESLNAALKTDPNSQAILNLSLVMAISNGEMEKVKALADKLYSVDAQDPATLKTCGIAALYLEDYPKAESLFQEGLRLQPANTEMENGLALALCEQDDPEKIKLALQHATSNLQKQNNNREFLATLGWVLFKSGDADKALSVLQHSAAGGRVNSQTAYYLAEVLNAKGQSENAVKLLDAAVAGTVSFAKRRAAEQLLAQLKIRR